LHGATAGTDAPELPRHWSVSDVEGTLVIDEEYSEGLRDIQADQRIVVIFSFHRSSGFSPELSGKRRARPAGRRAYSIPARP
jgi:tRNA (adenine37-N6)-methyltransferase